MDTLSGRATCQFPGDQRNTVPGSSSYFPPVQINQNCSIFGGYRTFSGTISNVLLFQGFIEDDGSKYSGTSLANTLTMGDQLRLMQYPAGDPFVQITTKANQAALYDGTSATDIDLTTGLYVNLGPSKDFNGPWTDTSIAQDLFSRAGVGGSGGTAIGGVGVTMADRRPIILNNQETPESLLTRIDQATGCKSFSTANGIVRMSTTLSPTTSPAWSLGQGSQTGSTIPILEIENIRTTRKFYNRVIVLGIKLGQGQIISIRSAPPNLPPAPGSGSTILYGRPGNQPITKTFQSDLIQSQDMADRLSQSLLTIGNRVEEQYTIKTALEPNAQPGQTVAVFAPAVKIASTINGFCLGLKHTFDSSGAFTHWTVAFYNGISGPSSSQPPTVGTYPPIVSGPFRNAP